MISRSTDRLKIMDIFILIVATCAGLWTARNYWDYDRSSSEPFNDLVWAFEKRFFWRCLLMRIGVMVSGVLFWWTVCLVLLGTRRIRTRSPRELQSAGMVVCIAGISLSLLGSLVLLVQGQCDWIGPQRISLQERIWPLVAQLPELNGIAVLSAGIALGVQGRLRQTEGWLDRAGGIVGMLWIALLAYSDILVPVWFAWNGAP